MRLLFAGLAMLMISHGANAADAYHPVARIETNGGYQITAVQHSYKDLKACRQANTRVIDAIKQGCDNCRVTRNDCTPRLAGSEADAIGGKALKSYSVSAPGLRVILSGPQERVRKACEDIAAQESVKGKARCLRPGQAA